VRTIEVKSKGGKWDSVLVSKPQFETALERNTNFWLYVVERSLDDDNYQIYQIQNPAHKVQKFAYKSDWIDIAEKAIVDRSDLKTMQPSSSKALEINNSVATQVKQEERVIPFSTNMQSYGGTYKVTLVNEAEGLNHTINVAGDTYSNSQKN
ncbi:protein NO VEIN domain-containing protein, partial [Chamaesiphon sp. VAR_69_metabat_338]|uniref:protein NO VEIN domain-containing protein n=1 Tax=Chamaesiphon sp. VAR_69_metabat_338 TaxID=2964704 RepID=UPI00286D7944